MNKDCIVKWLEENLDEERFSHSLGTAEMAVELAKKYNLDVEKAEIAGLLHDCAKCFPGDELLKIIQEKLPEIPECELLNYKTLHAPVGALIAREQFGVNDPEIIDSIKHHTLGRIDMGTFEAVIFLADKIEKNIRPEDFSEEILYILNRDGLDAALLECVDRTIKSLVMRRLKICQTTIDVYNWLLSR